MKLLKSYHCVADVFSGQNRFEASAQERLKRILRDGALRPPLSWADTPLPGTDQYYYYLFGLWEYVFFSYGKPYFVAEEGPGSVERCWEIDTEKLIELGGLVARENCLDPCKIGGDLFDLYFDHPQFEIWELVEDRTQLLRKGGDIVEDLAAYEHRANSERWEKMAWKMIREDITPALTYQGLEAVSYLAEIPDSEHGAVDILVPKDVPLEFCKKTY